MIRIATRRSPLALWQAQHVAEILGVKCELVHYSTEGDKNQHSTLTEIGGRGVFVKDIQNALLDGECDIAVHSAKDLPTERPEGLHLGAFTLRGEVRDALVGANLASISRNGKVGTSSSRRRCQLLSLRPDLTVVPIRGNISTRLSKIGELEAVMMAAVALERLEIVQDLVQVLPVESFCPQVGQGALAVECRNDDLATKELLQSVNHLPSSQEVTCERAMLETLGAGCTLPVGAYATYATDQITVQGFVGSLDGTVIIKAVKVGTDPIAVGNALGEELIEMGAFELLSASDRLGS